MADFGAGFSGGVPQGIVTGITTGAASNTKGSWTALGSFSEATAGLLLRWAFYHSGRSWLFDIALGSTSNIIINNLYTSGGTAGMAFSAAAMFVPIEIPAGTIVYGRGQASAASLAAMLMAKSIPFGGNNMLIGAAGQVTTFGAETANTSGMTVDSGAVANTYGSWYTLSSGIPYDAKLLTIAVGDNLDHSRSVTTWVIEVGVGATPVAIATLVYYAHSVGDFITPVSQQIFAQIPAGTPLKIRAKCTITTTDRLIDVVAYIQ